MFKRLKTIAVYILLVLPAIVFSQDVKTTIPKNAFIYLPVVKQTQQKLWSTHPAPWLIGALIEQESCISLKHSKCWNPQSKLETSRELGLGFGQITKAYKADGSIRFDSLYEMRKRHPTELAQANWETLMNRPDIQISMLMLQMKDNYSSVFLSKVTNPVDRYAFSDAAYNGGMGDVNKERRLCGLKQGCDPQKWFEHVEHTCVKGTKAIYGTRTACFINREHVYNVLVLRSEKYKPYLR